MFKQYLLRNFGQMQIGGMQQPQQQTPTGKRRKVGPHKGKGKISPGQNADPDPERPSRPQHTEQHRLSWQVVTQDAQLPQIPAFLRELELEFPPITKKQGQEAWEHELLETLLKGPSVTSSSGGPPGKVRLYGAVGPVQWDGSKGLYRQRTFICFEGTAEVLGAAGLEVLQRFLKDRQATDWQQVQQQFLQLVDSGELQLIKAGAQNRQLAKSWKSAGANGAPRLISNISMWRLDDAGTAAQRFSVVTDTKVGPWIQGGTHDMQRVALLHAAACAKALVPDGWRESELRDLQPLHAYNTSLSTGGGRASGSGVQVISTGEAAHLNKQQTGKKKKKGKSRRR